MAKKIQRYQIIEEIGQGAMAEVYKALDRHMDRTVAIKLLRQEYCVDHHYRQRLIREAKAVAKIPHENIVKVYDVGEEDNRPFIVMELLEGQFLDEWLRDNKSCDWQDVVTIGMNLAAALVQAHEQQIIHRDIKPANIIWQADKKLAKLTDFGIAHVANATQDTAFTKVGQLIGTPQYMSPEQIQGKAADQRSDLFSLGVVLYHLCVGQRPFIGDTLASLAYQITQSEPKPIKQINPAIPRRFIEIIKKLLAKSSSKRYQSAQDLLNDLNDFQQGKPSHRPGLLATWYWWAPATGLCVVLLAWWLWPHANVSNDDGNSSSNASDNGSVSTTDPDNPADGLSISERQQIQTEITAQLALLDCAALRVSVAADRFVTIRGHISKDEDFKKIEKVMEQTSKAINPVYDNIETLPWPHCEVASIIAPFKTNNSETKTGLQVSSEQANRERPQNEALVLDLRTPQYKSYIYIDMFQADGVVRHLYSQASDSKWLAPASAQLVYGQHQRWKLPTKEGKNMILVLASSNPLFDKKRQLSEAAQNYLSILHEKLNNTRQKVLADYITVTTERSL